MNAFTVSLAAFVIVAIFLLAALLPYVRQIVAVFG